LIALSNGNSCSSRQSALEATGLRAPKRCIALIGHSSCRRANRLANRRASIDVLGISKTRPVEILEQHYPILFDRFALREGSGGAGRHRGGFGVDYQIRLLRGEAKASFLMDHGRVGPPGLLGGSPGAVNEILVSQGGVIASPPHLSKGEGYVLAPGDSIAVKTPGGGGYGPAAERDPAMVERDIARGYYTDVEAVRLFTRTHAAAAE